MTFGRGALAASFMCATAVCAAKPAAERMDRSKLLIGAYCLQANAKTDAHIKAIHDCGVDFIIGGLPASDRTTLDLFAKHGVGAIVEGVVPRWWAGVERSGKMRAVNPPEKYAAGAAAFKDHPAIWAIDIGDEPSALDFPYYGDVVRQLNKAIPGAPDDPGYVKASNGAPLVVGEMVARNPASGERAFFVTAADDPADEHPAEFDIVFNVKAKRVEAFGGSGAIPVASRPDGSCSVPLASCQGVLIVLDWGP